MTHGIEDRREDGFSAVRFAVACEDGRTGPMVHGSRQRAEHVASRAAARRAVARVAGVRTGAVELRAGSRGLPEAVLPAGTDASVRLSVAHSEGRGAAVALRDAAGVRAGIDLERDDAVHADVARYFLSAAERARIGARELSELWALKEAAWKALRLDDTVHFTALELQLDDVGELVGLALHGRAMPARATISRPWQGFVLAVVLVGAPE